MDCRVKIEENVYLECEKRWVFALLMMVGGFFGGFTYNIRGGIFCNAQTANVVLLGLYLGHGNIPGALYFFIPISAYLLGSFISEYIPLPIRRFGLLRWDTIFIIVEICAVIFLALLPESAPHQISQVMLNFICSMQYNTFRQAQSMPMATTFCTNHIRQVGISLAKIVRHREVDSYGEKIRVHVIMLSVFVFGSFSAVFLTNIMKGRAMFFALIPLFVILIDFLIADFKTEKEILHQAPRGH